MVKTFKILYSRTDGLMALELGLWRLVPEYYQDGSNDGLGLILTYSTARSNMGRMLIHKISWNILKFWPKNW